MAACWACDDAPATVSLERRLGDVAVGPVVDVCEGCAADLGAI